MGKLPLNYAPIVLSIIGKHKLTPPQKKGYFSESTNQPVYSK